MPFNPLWQDLKDHFGKVGRVVFADVLREGGPGSRSKVGGTCSAGCDSWYVRCAREGPAAAARWVVMPILLRIAGVAWLLEEAGLEAAAEQGASRQLDLRSRACLRPTCLGSRLMPAAVNWPT